MRSIAGDLNIPLSGSSCNFQRLAEENGESENEEQETEPQVRLLLCPYFVNISGFDLDRSRTLWNSIWSFACFGRDSAPH